MKLMRSHLIFLITFLLFTVEDISAQTDLELYNKYIDRPLDQSNLLDDVKRQWPKPDSSDISLQGDVQQNLARLIKDRRQAEVFQAYLFITDTTNLEKVFELLQQFPNLAALTFSDYETTKPFKPKYVLPIAFLKLRQLRFFSIVSAPSLDARDTFDKLSKMPSLRGVDLLSYEGEVPQNSVLPAQLTFVGLTTPQLQHLNTKQAKWRMARIEHRGEVPPQDGSLLEKLAAIKPLENLNFHLCFIKDGEVFEKFKNLRTLKIYPILAKGTELFKSLSALNQLTALGINLQSDTSQNFSDLSIFKNLESLELRGIARFEKHPDELMSIGLLTKLRTLNIQSCILSTCPDFFTPLTKLESFTFKWNVQNWSQKSVFVLPKSLYELPELRSLTIVYSISEIPSLKKLTKLQYLNLSANNITRLPEDLADLKQLTTLSVLNNQLKDVRSVRWSEMVNLEHLDLSRNKINSFPEGVQHLDRLKYLNLGFNNITSFPSLDDKPYQMKILVVDNNYLDSIPHNINCYQDLQVLSAAHCGLESLPIRISMLKQLKELNLERNLLKNLPKELAESPNLAKLNLRNNTQLDAQSIYDVVFGRPGKRHLIANLSKTGLKALPANAPWDKLDLTLDLSDNQLKMLPVEMTRMKWFVIDLTNNPLPIDTGFIERGIIGSADAKILFQELGYNTSTLEVSNKQFAISKAEAVRWLSFSNSFAKAVKYAQEARELDSVAFQQNVNWLAYGIAAFEVKSYKDAIKALNIHMVKSAKTGWWGSFRAKDAELALAESYRKLGEKRKAAEVHAYFAERNLEAESSIDAALSYLEIGDEMLSKKHFDIAVAQSNVELSKYPKSRDLHIYNHAEVLLMANRPEEVIALFMAEDPKVLSYQPANRDYLETAAKLMIKPAAYKTLISDYINRIAKNGKVKDWSYLRFNRWLKVSNRSTEEQQHLHELEALNN